MQIILSYDNIVTVAIVGSRARNSAKDKEVIFNLVYKLKEIYGKKLKVISGGCKRR